MGEFSTGAPVRQKNVIQVTKRGNPSLEECIAGFYEVVRAYLAWLFDAAALFYRKGA